MSDLGTARQSRRQFLINAALASAAAGVGGSALTACGQGGSGSGGAGSKGRSGKEGETLFIAGFQWGPPNHFNPLGPDHRMALRARQHAAGLRDASCASTCSTEAWNPVSAKEIQEPDENTLVVPAAGRHEVAGRQAAHGRRRRLHLRPRQAARRALLRRPSGTTSTSVEATDDDHRHFTLGQKPYNPAMVKNNLAGPTSCPSTCGSPCEKQGKPMGEHENLEPIGSGPYTDRTSTTSSRSTLTRHDDYWGKAVMRRAGQAEDHRATRSSRATRTATCASSVASIDVMQQFTPQIWKMWEDKKLAVVTWFKKEPYHVPGRHADARHQHHQEGPGQPAGPPGARLRDQLRRHRRQGHVAATREPANSSVILPTGAEAKYLRPGERRRQRLEVRPRPGRPRSSSRISAPRRVPTASTCCRTAPGSVRTPRRRPTGWSDWQTALRIVAEQRQGRSASRSGRSSPKRPT